MFLFSSIRSLQRAYLSILTGVSGVIEVRTLPNSVCSFFSVTFLLLQLIISLFRWTIREQDKKHYKFLVTSKFIVRVGSNFEVKGVLKN